MNQRDIEIYNEISAILDNITQPITSEDIAMAYRKAVDTCTDKTEKRIVTALSAVAASKEVDISEHDWHIILKTISNSCRNINK